MIPTTISTWIAEKGFGQVVSSREVGGGCINSGMVLHTTTGQAFFLKTNTQAPADMFVREAEGLAALSMPGGPVLPQVYLAGPDFLLLEDLAPAARRPDYWPTFGAQLATLHEHSNPDFGFFHDNYLGSTPQPNPWTEDGHIFFGQHRLLYQARLARKGGLLGQDDVRQVEQLASRLPRLIPAQPASLLHGDLWSGNAISDRHGAPAIIDPAAHYGWGEAELAMTALFGAFPEDFYRAYTERRTLEPDYQDRFDLYNLYHLLNHLNLFGTGYLGQVRAVLRRYV
jgi:protein-ribulosamine 3-kinase